MSFCVLICVGSFFLSPFLITIVHSVSKLKSFTLQHLHINMMSEEAKPLNAFEKDQSWWWQRRTTLEKTLLILFLLTFLVAVGGLVGAVVYGRQQYDDYQNCQSDLKNPYTTVTLRQDTTYQQQIGQYMMDIVNGSNIQIHLRTLTKDFHPAGTDANKNAFDYITDTWHSYGLDKVELEHYDVLLSYPDFKNANTIHLQDGTLISNGTSTPLGPPEAMAEQHDQDALIWWNAYSANGSATGAIVYVNYCTDEDFQSVDGKVDFNGKIVLCRYGEGWRGSKVSLAEQRNASGVILYSDPADCGPKKSESSDFVFYESIYMPPSGAQRGSLNQLDGDPQTPLYPSKNYTYRWFTESELRDKKYLPNVPVMPIGYRDAINIFQNMQGGVNVTNINFIGGMNVVYKLTSDTVFKLTVNAFTPTRTIQNAIGYIWGSEEPDRQVLVSNHVDAWTYGAQDPNSGTAISLELSRIFMATINATGWRPRRTIVFCQWDAEEYGLLGSTEWAEQKLKTLESRAVALINVDVGVKGNATLSVGSVPLLYRVLMDASKLVNNPNPDLVEKNMTYVYDSWIRYKNYSLVPDDPSVPYMGIPSGGSDHKTFLEYVGIPVMDVTYDMSDDPDNYPLYHSNYEIAWTMENLVDVNYTVSKAMTQVWGEVVRNLADSLIIPFNVSDYGVMMIGYVNTLETYLKQQDDISNIVQNFDYVLSNLTCVANRFLNETLKIQEMVDKANSGYQVSLAMIEALNSRLLSLERTFIDPRGLPGRPHTRHVVFASSLSNLYSGAVFTGVTDSLSSYQKAHANGDQDQVQWKKIVNMQITAVQYSIESAIELFQLPPTLTI